MKTLKARGTAKKRKTQIALRRNFDDGSDSDSDINPIRLSQSILGARNNLKDLFSGASQETPKPAKPAPRKRGRPPKVRKVPDSPEISASTPESRLKHAVKLLESPEEWRRSSIHFDDIEKPGKRGLNGASPKTPQDSPQILPGKKRKRKKVEEPEQVSHDLNRRTSYSNRGKRALSIGNGFVARPHAEVSEKEYYKMLDSDLPGPNKMRQLLVWCFRKKLDQDSEESAESETARGIAKVIKQELLDNLIEGEIATSWYSRHDGDVGALSGKRIVRPNPLNESNRENVEIFTRKLRQLEKEKQTWHDAFDASVKPLEGLAIGPKEDLAALREYVSHRPELASVLLESLLAKLRGDVAAAASLVPGQLEENMDRLFHLLHRLSQSAKLVSTVQNDRLTALVAQLVQRFMGGRELQISSKDLLRGISRIDNPKA